MVLLCELARVHPTVRRIGRISAQSSTHTSAAPGCAQMTLIWRRPTGLEGEKAAGDDGAGAGGESEI